MVMLINLAKPGDTECLAMLNEDTIMECERDWATRENEKG